VAENKTASHPLSTRQHPNPGQSSLSTRQPALDWIRGLVMIMMGIGHVLMACYPEGRDSYHSWFFHTPGSVFSPAVFIPRFIGLICAPIFVFVAGTALAISVERRRAAGALEREIDRSLLIRGLVLIAIEFTWWFPLFIQILYAIGLGLICMILLPAQRPAFL